MNTDPGVEEWASGAHRAIRALVEELDGDTAAFDRDPLSFQAELDAFVAAQRPEDLSDEEWVWLGTQLVAYLAEVLTRVYGGRWERAGGCSGEFDGAGPVYTITVRGDDGAVRRLDPFELVRGTASGPSAPSPHRPAGPGERGHWNFRGAVSGGGRGSVR